MTRGRLTLASLAAICTLESIGVLARAPAAPPLAALAWMAGDWEMSTPSQCSEEHWSTPAGAMLVGMSRTLAAGVTRGFEFMRIEARADGIFYVAQPGGRPPVDFKLSTSAGPELVFLNPGHADRLKRIVYRRQGSDGLLARIEGAGADGRAFAVDYTYRRAPADPAARCGARPMSELRP